jgi:hypothetical protein
LKVLLASTEASRRAALGSKAAALARVYEEIPVHIVELAAATRHLLKETKTPARPKSVRVADTAARAFTRLTKKAPKRSSR